MEENIEYYLAIDIGASGGRHILGYMQNGRLCLEQVYRFSNYADGSDDTLVWNIERLFGEILTGIKMCKTLNKIPRTIGIDTWGVDYVLLDSKGKAILPAFCYRNTRTEKFVDTSVEFSEMYKRTGTAFNKFNTVYQLLADKAAGRLQNAKEFLMLPEYFSYLLTGKKAHEYTNASTTGLLNAKTGQWDYELIEALSLPKELFYDVVRAGHVLGSFTSEIKNKIGFDARVILPATHDTASAVYAAKDGMPYISSGTWSLLGVVGEPILTSQAMQCNYTNEGAVNGKIRFLKNIMGLWVIQQVRAQLDNKYTFAQLALMAENEAVFDWSIDINSQEFFAPASMIQTIQDGCKRAGQPLPTTSGQIAHCVFSSLAHSYNDAIEQLQSITGKQYSQINIIGGGSNNTYLNKLTARITGKKIIAGSDEATALGNLILQIATDKKLSENETNFLRKNSSKTEVF